MIALILTVLPGLCSAGMVGFPAARLQPLHFRLEVAGDSFREALQGDGDAEARTGRALLSVAFGLTSWSEVFARVGGAEFSVDEALFNGRFGVAYGGGVRFKLLSFPVGVLGLSAQYLRLTSNDNNSAGEAVDGAWEEVDVTLGFGTRRLGHFQFYAGVVYHHSDIQLDNRVTGHRVTLEAEQPFRLLLGVNLYPLVDFPGGDFLINVEVRVIGEIPQFTLGAQYAF